MGAGIYGVVKRARHHTTWSSGSGFASERGAWSRTERRWEGRGAGGQGRDQNSEARIRLGSDASARGAAAGLCRRWRWQIGRAHV